MSSQSPSVVPFEVRLTLSCSPSRSGDPTIVKYIVHAASRLEAEEAVRIRFGWPANAGVALNVADVETITVVPVTGHDGEGYLDSAERYLFQPDILTLMIQDAMRARKMDIEYISDSEIEISDVERYRVGPIVFVAAPRSAHGARLVKVEIDLGDGQSVMVFNGGYWVSKGPWIAATCKMLRALEEAATEIRGDEQRLTLAFMEEQAVDTEQKLQKATEILQNMMNKGEQS